MKYAKDHHLPLPHKTCYEGKQKAKPHGLYTTPQVITAKITAHPRNKYEYPCKKRLEKIHYRVLKEPKLTPKQIYPIIGRMVGHHEQKTQAAQLVQQCYSLRFLFCHTITPRCKFWQNFAKHTPQSVAKSLGQQVCAG